MRGINTNATALGRSLLSPTCSRCGSSLCGRGRAVHAGGTVIWTWACPCGRRRRVAYAERGQA
jgi:hypothetical protein